MIGDLPLGAVTSLSITATAPNAGAITVAATAAVVAAVPIDPDLLDNSTQFAVGVGETFSNGAVQILGNAQILSVAHGDVNGDGFTDIVLGTTAGVPAQVYLSSGVRDFSSSISVPDSVGLRDWSSS